MVVVEEEEVAMVVNLLQQYEQEVRKRTWRGEDEEEEEDKVPECLCFEVLNPSPAPDGKLNDLKKKEGCARQGMEGRREEGKE